VFFWSGRRDLNADTATNEAAFVWYGGALLNLNTLVDSSGVGWDLQYAVGINNSGQIVGDGISPSGEREAFLLTPASPAPGPIAGTGLPGVMTSIGCGMFVWWRRKRNVAALAV
jgi:hypothetical protein